MRYAVVDTGSNTIRMSVYEYSYGRSSEIFTEAIFANLAGHIVDNCLTDEGIDVCCDALVKHQNTAKSYDADFYAFATAAIRNANNAKEIVKNVKGKTDIDLEILSGEDEGELSFLGAYEDFPVTSGIMADVGGGSSEVIAFDDGKILAVQSIPWGSLKAYKGFVKGQIPTEEEAQKIKEQIKEYLQNNEALRKIKAENLCLVGGGVRAAKKLSKLLLGKENLDVASVKFMLSMFVTREDTEKMLEQVVPKRKLTITPGLAIYSAIGEFFGADEIYISDKGIKEGYVLKYLIH